jgi:adenine-specific DNA-methyltransferase
MGILLRLVDLLHQLDPDNKHWRDLQRNIAVAETKAAYDNNDKETRQIRLTEIDEVFDTSVNDPDYARKLYLIENCIYGVDIQPIAVQISKLRFFISLVIDQNKQPDKANLGIRSLPNLETKFVAANTLIGLEKPTQLMLRNPKIEDKEIELKNLRHTYFSAKTRKDKLKAQADDKALRQEIASLLINDGWKTTVAQQIVDFNPYDQNNAASWFDLEWMFGLNDGFDVVIGNPPYVQLQKEGGLLAKKYEKQGYETFVKTGDLYSLFYEKGMELLKNNSILNFITSNKWMRTEYGLKTRAFFCKHKPLVLIDLGSGVFETASVDTNILIIRKIEGKNKILHDNHQLKALDLSDEKDITDFRQFEDKWSIINTLNENVWIIQNSEQQKIKDKIEKIGKRLSDWNINLTYGIKTGLTDAFIIDNFLKESILSKDERSIDILKPVLRGKDIDKYKIKWANYWLITTHNGYKIEVKKDNKTEIYKVPRVDVNDFPAIKEHLNIYISQLEKRQDQGDTPYNLRSCAYQAEFKKEKIIWQEMASEPNFTYTSDEFFINDTCRMITGENIKFLLSYFNSNLFCYVFSKYYAGGGLGDKGIRFKGDFMKDYPIPNITPEAQQPFITLVEKILQGKKDGVDTSGWEREIDEKVYALYDLTPEEIAIVEGR